MTGDFFNNGSIDIASANDYGTGGADGVAILQNQTIYTTLAFRVYLSHPVGSTVVVKYATVNGTATAGTDYLPESGTLIFAPGQTEETVYVPVLSTASSNKTVVLQLSSASGAPIQVGTGVGTINAVRARADSGDRQLQRWNAHAQRSVEKRRLQDRSAQLGRDRGAGR